MGRLIISNAMTINGAFEAPVPAPDGWLVLDPDSQHASLQIWRAADAMVLGRKTYEGLAAAWPQLAEVPGYETFADQMNSMPKYVASRTLREPLEWNATLLQGDLAEQRDRPQGQAQRQPDRQRRGRAGPRPHRQGLVDEVWFTVSPYLWATGPRIFDDIGPVPLELIATTTFPSGVVQLSYRLAPARL